MQWQWANLNIKLFFHVCMDKYMVKILSDEIKSDDFKSKTTTTKNKTKWMGRSARQIKYKEKKGKISPIRFPLFFWCVINTGCFRCGRAEMDFHSNVAWMKWAQCFYDLDMFFLGSTHKLRHSMPFLWVCERSEGCRLNCLEHEHIHDAFVFRGYSFMICSYISKSNDPHFKRTTFRCNNGRYWNLLAI